MSRDSALAFTAGEFAAALRWYQGSNGFKGFTEFGYRAASSQLPDYAIRVGAELKIANGAWVDVSLGIRGTGSSAALIENSLNLRFATPE